MYGQWVCCSYSKVLSADISFEKSISFSLRIDFSRFDSASNSSSSSDFSLLRVCRCSLLPFTSSWIVLIKPCKLSRCCFLCYNNCASIKKIISAGDHSNGWIPHFSSDVMTKFSNSSRDTRPSRLASDICIYIEHECTQERTSSRVGLKLWPISLYVSIRMPGISSSVRYPDRSLSNFWKRRLATSRRCCAILVYFFGLSSKQLLLFGDRHRRHSQIQVWAQILHRKLFKVLNGNPLVTVGIQYTLHGLSFIVVWWVFEVLW